MSVVTIYTPSDACSSILRRVQWEDQEMPASVLDGIERIFGARIAPAEAVARILRDVRARGDAALHEWAQRIDRRPPGPLEVPAAAWRAAYERLPEEQRSALETGCRTHRSLSPQAADVLVGGHRAGRHAGPTDPAAGSRRRLRPRRHRAPALLPADGRHPGARGRRGRSRRLHPGRERGDQRPDPGCGVCGESGSAVCARWRAGDRRAGLRHGERAAGATRSSARAGCSSRWPSARCSAVWASTASTAPPRRWSSPTTAPTRPGPRPICWRRPSTTCWRRRSC